MPRRPLAAVARAHAIAAVIEDATHQQGVRTCPGDTIAIALLSKLLLDGLEQVRVENWRMLCGADLAFEDDLSDIEPVAQEISERASGEGNAADASVHPRDGGFW